MALAHELLAEERQRRHRDHRDERPRDEEVVGAAVVVGALVVVGATVVVVVGPDEEVIEAVAVHVSSGAHAEARPVVDVLPDEGEVCIAEVEGCGSAGGQRAAGQTYRLWPVARPGPPR